MTRAKEFWQWIERYGVAAALNIALRSLVRWQ
jgi:hypothetical protein